MSNMPLTIPGFPHPDINNEREVEVLQFVEVPKRSWNDANEVALGKPENLEVGKKIGDEGEDLEVLEGSEGVRDGAGEVVAGEVEVAEVGEERERGGEETGEEVPGEVEEVGETTENVDEEWVSDVGVQQVQSSLRVWVAGTVTPYRLQGSASLEFHDERDASGMYLLTPTFEKRGLKGNKMEEDGKEEESRDKYNLNKKHLHACYPFCLCL
ncbi:unnamed protein product [Sphenostylis stenocarpa]|uniref:Uncharacterized protein n=1 Tax=Sphenostylis stenocarpa TaxID=92480 RepID=A0AA86S2X6_9FABA|nr:unnamed protein product [Sphenostylis stenocarpa]